MEVTSHWGPGHENREQDDEKFLDAAVRKESTANSKYVTETNTHQWHTHTHKLITITQTNNLFYLIHYSSVLQE